MKKLVFGLIATTLLAFNGNAQEEQIKISSQTLEKYKVICSDVAKKIEKIKTDSKFKENPESFEEEIKETTKPLLDVSKELITESGITPRDVVEISQESFTDEQTIVTGLLLYSSQTDLTIESNSVGGCIANAVVGIELHEGFWSSFSNRRTMLRLLGRTLTRALGPIAAALMVYDFVDCMGWI